MTTVSNNLVEVAARAIRPTRHSACSDRRIAEDVLAAVGDALRLEGAQAERERIKKKIETLPHGTLETGVNDSQGHYEVVEACLWSDVLTVADE